MNSVTLGIFKFLWPLAVLSVLWVGLASLQRIDRVHLMTEPSLCLRAGLPVHDGQCVMDASLSWQFPSGRQLVKPLDGGNSGRPLILTSSESDRLSYGYKPESFHSGSGMPVTFGLCILALSIVLLPFFSDIKSSFAQLPGSSKSDVLIRRR